MAKMRAVQISKANGPFEVVEREIPSPGPGQVRIKVEACGIPLSLIVAAEDVLSLVGHDMQDAPGGRSLHGDMRVAARLV